MTGGGGGKLDVNEDTIFNMSQGGRTAPFPMGYESGKSPISERVNIIKLTPSCVILNLH